MATNTLTNANTVVVTTTDTPRVIVSAVGLQGPPGRGFNLLGDLPAGTTPSMFPTSPAPAPGDMWSVGHAQLYSWNGATWVLTLEAPDALGNVSFSTQLTYHTDTIAYVVTHNLNLQKLDVRVYQDNAEVNVGPPTFTDANHLTIPIIGAADGTVFDVVVTG